LLRLLSSTRAFFHRVRGAVLLAPLLGLLPAAGPAASAQLRLALAADVTSVDPHFLNIAPNNAIGWHVFDALTHVDPDARLVPGLAESWRAVDANTWEFRLRRGVHFHDGSEFMAEDVVFSMARAAKLPSGQFRSFVQRIVNTQVVDAYTLRLRTAVPYAMVPYDLNSIFIVSRRAAANASTEDFNSGRAMVGTGPFKFGRFVRGDRIELTRNEAYWGDKSAWASVSLRIISSDPARSAALLSGELDAIEQVPTADLPRFRSDPRFHTAEKPSWRTLFFHADQRASVASVWGKDGKPLARNPLQDRRVRQALSKAIDRQAIVERLMEKGAIPASNLVAPSIFGYDPALKPESHDPEGARQLLREAGYAEGFGLTLAAPNNRYANDEQVAQAVAQMLARIGVTARVQLFPVNAYLPKARKSEFALAMLGWGSFSGDLALRSLAATPTPEKGFGAWNWSHYSNPQVDALLERAFATLDEKQREALARQAMDMAMRDYAVIPLHHQMATWAMTQPIVYTPRTDEYSLAHRFRPR
jgi:peptide/nickel transport system substrate-binding protein